MLGQQRGATSPSKQNLMFNQRMSFEAVDLASCSFVSNFCTFKPTSKSQFKDGRNSHIGSEETSSNMRNQMDSFDHFQNDSNNSFGFDNLEDMNLNEFNDFYESGEGANATRYDCIERPKNPFYKNFETHN